MSEATDKLTVALAELSTTRDARKNIHAAHDNVDKSFAVSLSAANEAAKAVLAEIEAIAADSENAAATPGVVAPQP